MPLSQQGLFSATSQGATPTSRETTATATATDASALVDGNEFVEVHSFDGDGSSLPCFSPSEKHLTMAEYNATFVTEQIHKHNNPSQRPEKTIFMVGSARQGMLRDLLCCYQNGGIILPRFHRHQYSKINTHIQIQKGLCSQ